MCIHWGTEYDTLPSAEQKMLAAAMFRSGADIIIGSSSSCDTAYDSRYVIHAGLRNPVVWSMGNFVSNQRPAEGTEEQ